MNWKAEHSAHGDGPWFVAVGSAQVRVLAPPGVRITDDERYRELRRGAPGWRMARWHRHADGTWPQIDSEPPEVWSELTTVQAVGVLPPDLQDRAFSLLMEQLELARAFGRAAPGRAVCEETARQGAITSRFLEEELVRAFPERAHAVRTRRETLTSSDIEVPATPAALLGLKLSVLDRIQDWARIAFARLEDPALTAMDFLEGPTRSALKHRPGAKKAVKSVVAPLREHLEHSTPGEGDDYDGDKLTKVGRKKVSKKDLASLY